MSIPILQVDSVTENVIHRAHEVAIDSLYPAYFLDRCIFLDFLHLQKSAWCLSRMTYLVSKLIFVKFAIKLSHSVTFSPPFASSAHTNLWIRMNFASLAIAKLVPHPPNVLRVRNRVLRIIIN